MSCEACYNGCVEIVSDQCVRYTGPNITALNITTGDTLLHVEEMITNKLVPLLVGTGDVITIASGDRCALINGFLTGITSPNSTQLFTALVKSVCSLQTQVTAVAADITVLNADYTIGCLTGVTASSDTHAILQAVITRLCAVASELDAFELSVPTTYVKLADLNALIAAYITSQSGGPTQQYLKMVPYTAVEYYGPLTNFNNTGAGIGTLGWDKIYLCNGSNGTPDKRGRVGVGAILNVPGGPLDAAVNPANAGNPNYAVYNTGGANTVTLITSQIPAHTHNATVAASGTVPNHTHIIMGGSGPGNSPAPNALQVAANEKGDGGNASYKFSVATSQVHNSGISSASGAGPVSLSVAVSNSNTGGGGAHQNIQPVLAAYYIMYIP
jgi:microcystin-dependent protein